MERYLIKYGKKTIKTNDLLKINRERKELSIVIPTYNEEKTIEKLVKEIRKNLEKTKFKESYEIIVVDDKSRDKTPELINELSRGKSFVTVHRLKDKGIGSAVIDGIDVARGEYVLTMDADFSHPPEKIPEILKDYKKYDIISASRFIRSGGMEAPFLRYWGSKILNRICGIILDLKIRDLGGNFRLFNRKKFLELDLSRKALFGEFGFEIFYKAKKKNYKMKEIPFVYKFRKEGKSKMGNLAKYGLTYIKRAFELRFNN
jgi:dolichol-phosphate mannosyltransferase